MPSANSNILYARGFDHKGVLYDVAVFIDPADPWTYHVDVTSGGNSVVITYPGGQQAILGYSVSFTTRFDMVRIMGVDALSCLTETAEADVRRWV